MRHAHSSLEAYTGDHQSWDLPKKRRGGVSSQEPYSEGEWECRKDVRGAAPALLFLEYYRALDRVDLTTLPLGRALMLIVSPVLCGLWLYLASCARISVGDGRCPVRFMPRLRRSMHADPGTMLQVCLRVQCRRRNRDGEHAERGP